MAGRAAPLRSWAVYGFLRRPKWIALTIGVVLLMVGMVSLGFWQLRRLDTRKALNAEVRQHSAAAPVTLDSLLVSGITSATAKAVEWRTVMATGVYDTADEVLVANRSFDGEPGLHVLTPLDLADGRTLLVNRGWVPIATTVGGAVVVPPPPTGDVTVTARVRATQVRGALGPRDPTTGRLHTFARADVARIAEQLNRPVVPAYVELIAAPGQDTIKPPRPLPLPALDDGPHLSYAVQWFIFTICAAAGWIAVVRRQLREQRRSASAPRTAGDGAAPSTKQTA